MALSFDLADLCKTSIALEVACEIAAEGADPAKARARMNHRLKDERAAQQMLEGLFVALGLDRPELRFWRKDDLALWDPDGDVPANTQYGYEDW